MYIYELLIYQREAIAQGEIWRLLTGQLLHINTEHFLYNFIAFLMLYLTSNRLGIKNTIFYLYVFFSQLVTGLILFLVFPGVIWYVGASGFLHGIFLILSLQIATKFNLIFGLILIAILILKLFYENQFGVITQQDFIVITQAHLSGFFAGVLLLLVQFLNLLKIRRHKKTRWHKH